MIQQYASGPPDAWADMMPGMLQPFNAFLSGFSATVGQFVLTASLRIQTNPENKEEFKSVSHERYKYKVPFGGCEWNDWMLNLIWPRVTGLLRISCWGV